MGQNRVELLTPALSEQCSNRLSYWPVNKIIWLLDSSDQVNFKKGKGRVGKMLANKLASHFP